MSRVTVSITDKLEGELHRFAVSQKESVSKVASRAIEYYLNAVKRRELGRKVLDLAGKQTVSPDAVSELEAGRIDCVCAFGNQEPFLRKKVPGPPKTFV